MVNLAARSSSDERESIYRRNVEPLASVIERIAEAEARRDSGAKARAVAELARFLGQTLAGCALLGARRAVLLAESIVPKPDTFATEVKLFVPRVPFTEAVDDVLSRMPQLRGLYERVSDIYAKTHAFVLAKSADIEITKRVQKAIGEEIRDGQERGVVRRAIAAIGGWTQAYAETVFRNNAGNAYSAGTWAQAQDPDVREVMPAFQFSAVRDADTRPNHAAAHGLIARTDDPIWDHFYPLLGHRCRCDAPLISKYELERLGLYDPKTGIVTRRLPADFAHAHADEGFVVGNPMRRITT